MLWLDTPMIVILLLLTGVIAVFLLYILFQSRERPVEQYVRSNHRLERVESPVVNQPEIPSATSPPSNFSSSSKGLPLDRGVQQQKASQT
jgi:hypothetical protein